MKTSNPRLYSKIYNSYAIWNGVAWEDKKTNAYFYSIEKANNNSYFVERETVMEWWNNLTLEHKFYKVIPWLKSQGLNATDRHPDSLTGREIEQIYLKEQES